ncbi:molybdopterin-dependent oxidoreductase, partial [Burkholderia sp.]|uniref:molybdopterin-dependent oxidoreductase n=1 Tax=Burkholderia sp. TaxID=36773 RepID=UPI00258C4CE2
MTATPVKSVCPYCGVGCGMVLHVEDDEVVKVSGDSDHPTNFGRLCTKGSSAHVALRRSGRLDRAFVRRAREDDLVPLPARDAIAETARRLRAVLDTHGPDALSFYVSGQMSIEAQYLVNKLAKGFVGTNNIESNSRLCMASASTGYKQSLGADGPPGSYQDFDRANLFFVIGANMADCHPILFLRMMDRVKAGAKLIVVDPRRTGTADKADLFTVMARTGDDPGARGVSAFLVPRTLAGVSVGEPEKKMGQKGAKVADVHFDDVVVTVENRLGAEGEGFKIAMRVLDRGRLHISAV